MMSSIIYRLIILLFSWYIANEEVGIISPKILCVIAVMYFILYLYLLKKEKAILRMILDFLYINLVIWGRDVNTSMPFLLILLPLINAINFSGRKRHTKLLMILMFITYMIHMKTFQNWALVSMISIWLIYYTSWIKVREWNVINDISLHIDGFFINQKEIQKPHLIYEHIINDLNNFFFMSDKNGISQIRSYTIRGNKLWLVKSSKFLWERTLDLSIEELNSLRKNHVITKKTETQEQVLTYIHQGDLEYVFLCIIENPQGILSSIRHRFNYVLLKTFSKVALLHNSEFRIMEKRNEKFNEIKDNLLYVNKAVKIMHYIRNKLTPMTNVIAFYREEKKMSEEVRTKMFKYMDHLVYQADKDLKDILTTANYLLDKSNNPYVQPALKQVHVSKIYIFVSEVVEQLLGGIVEADESLRKQLESNLVVDINILETKIMLTDWVNNMRKYMLNDYSVIVKMEENKLVINFENNFKAQEDDIIQLVKDMNNKSKDAVIEGKNYGYGVFTIKSIAADLGIGIESYIDIDESKQYKTLNLNFIFQTYERKEDFNI